MIRHKKLENGFPYIEISNKSATAKIALQGAHIFEYTKNSQKPTLWLSKTSKFELGESIRGGIPVCWPWFGQAKELPQHGFARTSMWECSNTNDIDENNTEVALKLSHSKQSLKLWPYKFELELHIIISDTLTLELKTTNIDDKKFSITQALHTYFSISHISDVEIKGLNNKPYLDALRMKNKRQEGVISFDGEVDRVYQEVDSEICLKDKKRTIKIKNSGSSSVVVWNPWIDKCMRMSAMMDSAYENMVCIESANAFEDKRVIEPNESHTLKATIY